MLINEELRCSLFLHYLLMGSFLLKPDGRVSDYNFFLPGGLTPRNRNGFALGRQPVVQALQAAKPGSFQVVILERVSEETRGLSF